MPVVRLTLLEFLQHRLAQDPFWCQRLAWVPQAEAGGPAPTEQPPYLWEDMRAQLREVLAHEQTWQQFLAYLVDPLSSPISTPCTARYYWPYLRCCTTKDGGSDGDAKTRIRGRGFTLNHARSW